MIALHFDFGDLVAHAGVDVVVDQLLAVGRRCHAVAGCGVEIALGLKVRGQVAGAFLEQIAEEGFIDALPTVTGLS